MNTHELTVPTMVSITEAARRTGLSRYYLRQACETGEIVHIRSGRYYLINLDRLIDHMNGKE